MFCDSKHHFFRLSTTRGTFRVLASFSLYFESSSSITRKLNWYSSRLRVSKSDFERVEFSSFELLDHALLDTQVSAPRDTYQLGRLPCRGTKTSAGNLARNILGLKMEFVAYIQSIRRTSKSVWRLEAWKTISRPRTPRLLSSTIKASIFLRPPKLGVWRPLKNEPFSKWIILYILHTDH